MVYTAGLRKDERRHHAIADKSPKHEVDCESMSVQLNIGASMIRIGFWGPL